MPQNLEIFRSMKSPRILDLSACSSRDDPEDFSALGELTSLEALKLTLFGKGNESYSLNKLDGNS